MVGSCGDEMKARLSEQVTMGYRGWDDPENYLFLHQHRLYPDLNGHLIFLIVFLAYISGQFELCTSGSQKLCSENIIYFLSLRDSFQETISPDSLLSDFRRILEIETPHADVSEGQEVDAANLAMILWWLRRV